jgi:hypothetical protein
MARACSIPVLAAAGVAFAASIAAGAPPIERDAAADAFITSDSWLFGAQILDDMDGDGIAELVVLEWTGHRVLSGRTLTEISRGGGFGQVAVQTTDLDGDGVRDIAIGPREIAAPALPRRYAVEIYSARTGELLRLLDQPDGWDVTYGRTMLSGPDLNGDGVEDILIADGNATLLGVGNSDDGLVECRSGADGALLWRFAPQNGEYTGTSIALIDDLDNDGAPEVLVGSPERLATANNTPEQPFGAVYVLSGASGTVMRTHPGLDYFTLFGLSCAPAGDIDGDGVGDYAIGSPAGLGDGSIEIFSGATGVIIRVYKGVSLGVKDLGLNLRPTLSPAGDGALALEVDGGVITAEDSFGYLTIDPRTGEALRYFIHRRIPDSVIMSFVAGDIDGDNAGDLLILTPRFSSLGSDRVLRVHLTARNRSQDLNGDGVVDGDDLGALLAEWGTR